MDTGNTPGTEAWVQREIPPNKEREEPKLRLRFDNKTKTSNGIAFPCKMIKRVELIIMYKHLLSVISSEPRPSEESVFLFYLSQ